MLQERNIIISSITIYIKENILISLIDYKIDIGLEDFSLSPPKQESFGDLSSNIALLISKQIQKNPLEIAEEIKKTMLHQNLNDIENITAELFLNLLFAMDFRRIFFLIFSNLFEFK